jgi:hypothetical protein
VPSVDLHTNLDLEDTAEIDFGCYKLVFVLFDMDQEYVDDCINSFVLVVHYGDLHYPNYLGSEDLLHCKPVVVADFMVVYRTDY